MSIVTQIQIVQNIMAKTSTWTTYKNTSAKCTRCVCRWLHIYWMHITNELADWDVHVNKSISTKTHSKVFQSDLQRNKENPTSASGADYCSKHANFTYSEEASKYLQSRYGICTVTLCVRVCVGVLIVLSHRGNILTWLHNDCEQLCCQNNDDTCAIMKDSSNWVEGQHILDGQSVTLVNWELSHLRPEKKNLLLPM